MESTYTKKNIIIDKKILSHKERFFILCIYLLVFQNVIQEIISPMKYFDELLAIIIFPIAAIYFAWNKGKAKVMKGDIYILILMLILTCAGLYSNFRYKYQPFSAAIQDILLVWKFYLAYFTSKVLFSSLKNNVTLKMVLNINCKLITLALFGLSILDYALDIFPSERKYGLRVLHLFYSHPTFFACVCIFLLALLIYSDVKKDKKTYIYIAMLLIMNTLTFRAKAMAMSAIAIFLYIYMVKLNKKITVTFGIVMCILALFIAADKISYYFFEIDRSARQQLLEQAIYIARDYFPFGTGFGTYGSNASKELYSPIYYMYNLNTVWGLSEKYDFFISDSFWPMILGQFGVIGFVSYVFGLIIFFRRIQKNHNKEDNSIYFSAMLLFLYLVIASTAESAFVNSYAPMFSFLFGILI